MIEIAQAGQGGKTKLLFEMHRLRARIFRERMGWDVSINEMGMEIDQFDIQEAVYFLAVDDEQNVIGSWRLLPSIGPTMIGEIWPEFMDTLPMPQNPHIWEASRFGVFSTKEQTRESLKQVGKATGELFCALTEACILCGIHEVYTLYDARIERLIKRLNCHPENISEPIPIDGIPCRIGRFITNHEMLLRIRNATGISQTLILPENLPPILSNMHSLNQRIPLLEDAE